MSKWTGMDFLYDMTWHTIWTIEQWGLRSFCLAIFWDASPKIPSQSVFLSFSWLIEARQIYGRFHICQKKPWQKKGDSIWSADFRQKNIQISYRLQLQRLKTMFNPFSLLRFSTNIRFVHKVWKGWHHWHPSGWHHWEPRRKGRLECPPGPDP